MVEALDLEKYQYLKKKMEFCDDLSKYLSTGINDFFDSIFGIDIYKEGLQEWKCPFCGETNTIEIETLDPETQSKIIENLTFRLFKDN